VIAKLFPVACRDWLCCAANWLARVFFDGALAEAPASARLASDTTASRTAKVPATAAVRLNMASSI